MKRFLLSIVTFTFLIGTFTVAAPAQNLTEGSAQEPTDTAMYQENNQIVVYYLHMNRRCMTCEKLESYSKEAVEAGFSEQLKDSSIIFRVENFEVEGNEHFAKDYQLFSQSLILSRQHDGKETDWKNLDQIWELVGDKDEFIKYVQTEINNFRNNKVKK